MINLHFKTSYKIIHFTNEIGQYMLGGIATFMNELYPYHREDTGFIHIYDARVERDIRLDKYPGDHDLLAVSYEELDRLGELSYDVAVVHYYGLSFLLHESLLKGRELIYVVHSVPTTEPYSYDQPFGEHEEIKQNFEGFCSRATWIVCVSFAEERKLASMYPHWRDKIKVIHNGRRFDVRDMANPREERRVFGFIGRLDYRKGLLECVRAFRGIEGELRLACGNEDPLYLASLKQYIDAAGLTGKVRFYGWCSGERKKSFLQSLDALIVPSLYEPFGYVVLEAMNEGIQLISSNRGGIAEIIGDYRYQFDPYEENALAECLALYQRDSVEQIRQEQNNLRDRKALFQAENMALEYEKLFSLFR